MDLSARLVRLERRVVPARELCCRGCGLPVPLTDPKIRVEWPPDDGPHQPPCPACGRRDTIRIEFDREG